MKKDIFMFKYILNLLSEIISLLSSVSQFNYILIIGIIYLLLSMYKMR